MVWKKRGCWHGQVEAWPSRPFCSPAPTACLPDRFQGRSGPFIPRGSSTPSTSPCLPPSTQTSARGLAQPCKSGSLPEVKFPLQQAVGTAWPGAWLSSLGAPAGIFHHAACPTVVSSDLVSLSSFLLVPPGLWGGQRRSQDRERDRDHVVGVRHMSQKGDANSLLSS